MSAGQRATATIKPVKVVTYDPDLHCDVSGVVGYRVKCRCSWRSSVMPSYKAARAALARHRETHTEKDAPSNVRPADLYLRWVTPKGLKGAYSTGLGRPRG